jgi:hypothetical protein
MEMVMNGKSERIYTLVLANKPEKITTNEK